VGSCFEGQIVYSLHEVQRMDSIYEGQIVDSLVTFQGE
jgi:hypothetical protein